MYPKVKAKNLSYKINEKNLFQNISFELFPSRAIHIRVIMVLARQHF